MKKQKQGRLLCALCLALLLIPLAGMLLAGPSDAVSNERLAAKPRLMRGGKLNPDFLSETADYFAGHFYLRPALLTANSTVQAAVFRESASEDVVLGDGGWLFYADTLEDFQGTNPMTGRALFCAARNLALLQEYCAQQGTKFLFVCAPNKNTSYPEYMPGQYRKTEQVSDLDRLEQALDDILRNHAVLRPVCGQAHQAFAFRFGRVTDAAGKRIVLIIIRERSLFGR